MEGCELVTVNVAEFEEAGGELGCELGSSVSDNVVREAMVLKHMR